MIRVLVVDDSATSRHQIASILEAARDIRVVGQAGCAAEALEAAARLRPDVVTMDVHMPDVDGIEATERILAQLPLPIVVVTSADASGDLAVRALGAGAVDLVAKAVAGADLARMARDLVRSVRLMAEVRVVTRKRKPGAPPTPVPPGGRLPPVVAIGSSTGGPDVVRFVLEKLPRSFPGAVLVAQHIAAGFDASLAEWWGRVAGLEVRLAAAGDRPEPGRVLLAPALRHLELDPGGSVVLPEPGPAEMYVPSVDRLLTSVARACQARSVGLVVSGMGDDGAQGLSAMQAAGAGVAVQRPDTAVVNGMPARALERVPGAAVLAPVDLPSWLVAAVAGRAERRQDGP